jgi:hypothetical protein
MGVPPVPQGKFSVLGAFAVNRNQTPNPKRKTQNAKPNPSPGFRRIGFTTTGCNVL